MTLFAKLVTLDSSILEILIFLFKFKDTFTIHQETFDFESELFEMLASSAKGKVWMSLYQSRTYEPGHEKTCLEGFEAATEDVQRGLKFLIYEVERLYYLCRENKGAEWLPLTA